ncbi:MFS transporter [Pandoraea apista]|nr:MFS transporter [Pandoraea apista]
MMESSIGAASFVSNDSADPVFRKILKRLMPLVFVAYLCAFLDRINVGYAQLQMKDMLGFSDAVYGLGAGVFFISYLLCEVPSNMLFVRMGARKTFLRIMVLWGLTSAAMMFVKTPTQFYVMRFLLGAFEAGFFPGVILYLSYWFTPQWRGRATSAFLFALPVAGVIGGPLSGAIMRGMNGVAGLAGWQWCFMLEGLPTVLVGYLCYRYLADKPADAAWLTPEEKAIVAEALHQQGTRGHAGWHEVRQALAEARVYTLGLIYFSITCGAYAFSFWLPTMIKALGVSDPALIGAWSLIPYAAGAIGTWIVATRSDRRKSRRGYIAGSLVIGAAALVATTFSHQSLAQTLVLFSVANFFMMGAGAVFWAVPSTVLNVRIAPAGIALVSSIGILGGFVSPTLMGWMRGMTGNFSSGLQLVSAILLAGACVAMLSLKRGVDAHGH